MGDISELYLQRELQMVSWHRLVQGKRFVLVQRTALQIVSVDIVEPSRRAIASRQEVVRTGRLGRDVVRNLSQPIGRAGQRLEEPESSPSIFFIISATSFISASGVST